MGDFDTLSIRASGPVMTITLERPELRNRFDMALHEEFRSALLELRDATNIRAAVLVSTGPAFSAGGDFDLMLEAHQDPALRRRLTDGARDLLTTMRQIVRPIVAGVQGPAIGLGATIALSCDAIVAARDAKLADTHVQAGLTAGDGGCLVWPAAAGMLRARRHLLTGDPLTASDAYSLGLVTDLVETPDEVVPAALDLAGRIAALPPLAVQSTKRALNAVTRARADEVLDRSLELEEATMGSDDLLEAVAAFREGRPGRFQGG